MDDVLAAMTAKTQAKIQHIGSLTDAFCAAHLNEEFRDICRELINVAWGAGVPLESGKAVSWAAGVVGTVAFVNFLGDPEQQFHMTLEEAAKKLGSSEATLHSKMKAIRDTLKIDRLDPQFAIQKHNENNPLIWMMYLDNVLVDIRKESRELQETAFELGQIPFIPADGPGTTLIRHWLPAAIESKGKKKTSKKPTAS